MRGHISIGDEAALACQRSISNPSWASRPQRTVNLGKSISAEKYYSVDFADEIRWTSSIVKPKSPVKLQSQLHKPSLNGLYALAVKIRDKFDDIRERQIIFSDFKKYLDDAWNLIPEDDQARDIIILLHNALHNIKSEKLKKEQINALVDITTRLKRGGITEDDVDAVVDIILEAKLNPIIPIRGLSEMYDL